jgi:hypothetical protein
MPGCGPARAIAQVVDRGGSRAPVAPWKIAVRRHGGALLRAGRHVTGSDPGGPGRRRDCDGHLPGGLGRGAVRLAGPGRGRSDRVRALRPARGLPRGPEEQQLSRGPDRTRRGRAHQPRRGHGRPVTTGTGGLRPHGDGWHRHPSGLRREPRVVACAGHRHIRPATGHRTNDRRQRPLRRGRPSRGSRDPPPPRPRRSAPRSQARRPSRASRSRDPRPEPVPHRSPASASTPARPRASTP